MRYTISSITASLLLATSAMAEVPRVITDIPAVQSIVAMVMGDLGQPDVLVGPGADPHSFQLRPSQATSLQSAQLVIWIGPEMTPWLERSLEGSEIRATRIALLDAAVTKTRVFVPKAASGTAALPATDETKPHIDKQGAQDTEEGRDPHAWLDPDNAVAWLALIAAELGRLDPENAAIYAANAAEGVVEIGTVKAEISVILDPIKAKPLVVYHDAYGYFSSYFGLNVAGELAVGDATSPGAAEVAALRETLASGAPVCIFPESNQNPKLLQQIAEGTPVSIGGVLDPEGAALAPGAALYPDLMRALAATLADCLGKS